jgi:hypothetical protein
MVATIFDKAADRWWIIVTCVVFQIMFLGLIFPKLRVLLNELEAGPPPDIRFGYTPRELNVWYDAIGEEGCKSYMQLAMLDVFPYMVSYTLVLGGLLVKVARRASVSEQVALLAPLLMMLDVVETVIPAYGCFLYPEERLSTELIQVSSLANQLKWVIFGCSLILLVVLFAMSKMKPATHANKKD